MNTPSPRRLWIPSPRLALLLVLALVALTGMLSMCIYIWPRHAAFAYLQGIGTISGDAPKWMPEWAKPYRWLLPVDGFCVTDRGPCDLAPLTPYCEARHVELFYCQLDDRDFAPIKRFRRIVRLVIDGTKVTDAGLAALRDCQELESFSCGDTTISDAGLAHLAGLPLQNLDLQSTAVSGAGLRYLEAAPLTYLMLHQTPITDAGMANLSRLRSLRALGLQSTRITDAGLVHLEGLPIKHLNLIDTRVTNAGIATLEQLPLATLDLAGTDVTPAVIPTLLRIKTLEQLIVSSPAFAEEDVQSLQAAGLVVHVWKRD